jgi:PTS system cellobiose-specific IIB component
MIDLIKILVVCSSGMSTSLLVKAMQKAAGSTGTPAEIKFSSIIEAEDKIEGFDVVLVGPQIRHRFDNVKNIAEQAGKIAALIPNHIFGTMDGKAALKFAIDLNK